MKNSIITLLLLLSSFLGYLEWGIDQKRLVIQSEWEIILKAMDNPLSVLHPFIILPFIGQILLIISLFKKKNKRRLHIISILSIACLYAIILFIGLLEGNINMIVSTWPFIIMSIITLKNIK